MNANFKSKVDTLVEEAEKIKKVLAENRDRLRDIAVELEGIAESCDSAEWSLYDAISSLKGSADSLSEYF